MKRILLMAVVTIMCMVATAQKVYGNKAGWTVYTTEDEYSGKKSYCLRYYDSQRVLAASFWPGIDRMAVLEWYDGVLFMDETLDAVTEHHGEFPDRQVDYEWRVALPKNESEEDYGTVKMKFGSVEQVGETFFGTFVFNADGEAMKAGQSIAVCWHDPMRGKQVVRKIPLTGFTRCYNECMRRYGVKIK